MCEEQTCVGLKSYIFITYLWGSMFLFSQIFIHIYIYELLFLSWILHIHKLCQNFWKSKFQFFHKSILWNFQLYISSCFSQMKVFSKVLISLYIYIFKIKKIKKKSLHFLNEPCNSTYTWLKTWLINNNSPNHYKISMPNKLRTLIPK